MSDTICKSFNSILLEYTCPFSNLSSIGFNVSTLLVFISCSNTVFSIKLPSLFLYWNVPTILYFVSGNNFVTLTCPEVALDTLNAISLSL